MKKKYTPLGSEKEFTANVRFVSATNKNIRNMLVDKEFREDLYRRMSVLSYTIPPLRDRKVDIPSLAYHFLYSHGKEKSFTVNAMDKLVNYFWPGNIRELRNCIARAVILNGSDRISMNHITFDF